MIDNGADLAPLMGTFSFSGRDTNYEDEERIEEKKTVIKSTPSPRQSLSMAEDNTIASTNIEDTFSSQILASEETTR